MGNDLTTELKVTGSPLEKGVIGVPKTTSGEECLRMPPPSSLMGLSRKFIENGVLRGGLVVLYICHCNHYSCASQFFSCFSSNTK